jgi:hypothetical protein
MKVLIKFFITVIILYFIVLTILLYTNPRVIFPKNEYPDMNSFYRKFPESLSHSVSEIKSIREQLFVDSKQRLGGDSIYNSIFETLNQRTDFWVKRSQYRFPQAKSLVFMDSLILLNRNKNIALCVIYNIATKNSYYDVRVKDRIVINEKGIRDTIYEKDSIKTPIETDFYVRLFFQKKNNEWKVFHEEMNGVPKLGYMNIAHTPEQMKILGVDYFFYSFIKVKNINTGHPKLIGYHEKAFKPRHCWIFKTYDD